MPIQTARAAIAQMVMKLYLGLYLGPWMGFFFNGWVYLDVVNAYSLSNSIPVQLKIVTVKT